jgi:hypothetical protein
MKNKMFIAGMLSVLLVFGFVLSACSGNSEDADTWSEVTADDFANLIGTWKGSPTIRFNEQDISKLMGFSEIPSLTIPATSVSLDISFRLTEGFEAFIAGTVRLSNMLDALTNSEDVQKLFKEMQSEMLDELFPDGAPSSLTKDVLWGLLTELLEDPPFPPDGEPGEDYDEYLDNITVGANYSLVLSETSVSLLELGGTENGSPDDPKVEINQDGKKIRIVIPSTDVSIDPITITLYKQ